MKDAIAYMRDTERRIIAQQAATREFLFGRENAERFEAKALRQLDELADDEIREGRYVMEGSK